MDFVRGIRAWVRESHWGEREQPWVLGCFSCHPDGGVLRCTPLCSVQLKLLFDCSVAMAFAYRALIGSMLRLRFDPRGGESVLAIRCMLRLLQFLMLQSLPPNSRN